MEIISEYILMILLSERFSNFAISVSERSGFPKINRSEISFFCFSLPSKAEQHAIALSANAIEEKIMKEQEFKEKLLHFKQALMQDLLTGKVRVPEKMMEAMP